MFYYRKKLCEGDDELSFCVSLSFMAHIEMTFSGCEKALYYIEMCFWHAALLTHYLIWDFGLTDSS